MFERKKSSSPFGGFRVMPSKNRYCLNLALDNRMGRVLGDNKVRVVGRNKTPRHVPQTQGIIR